MSSRTHTGFQRIVAHPAIGVLPSQEMRRLPRCAYSYRQGPLYRPIVQFEESRSAPGLKAVFFFCSILTYQEGEGQPRVSNFARMVCGQPSCRLCFFSSHCPRRKTRPTRGDPDPAGAAPSALPALRRADAFIIDLNSASNMRILNAHRRGSGFMQGRRARHHRPRHRTFTVLPDWSPPSGHYTLHCRQQAWELRHQADGTWERSIPDVADASRSPDPSTVRRWAGRLLHLGTLLATKLWQATGWSVLMAPTILAWDWTAIRRILLLEASSP